MESKTKITESIGKGIAEIKEGKSIDFNKKFDTIVELLEEIHITRTGITEAKISSDNLFTFVKSIIESNQEFSLIKQVHQMNLDISDKIFFLELIWNEINGTKENNVMEMLSGILYTADKCFKYLTTISEKRNKLVKLNLIEITPSYYINKINVTLSETSLKLLQEEGIKMFTDNKTIIN